MPVSSKGRRPATIKPRNIDDETAPDTDRLILWSSSHYGKRLPTKEQWIRHGRQTGDYTGITPTYTFTPLWGEDDDLGSDTLVISKALERCFGKRSAPGWSIWIQGDALLTICKQFRQEYIKLEEQEDSGIRFLDIWAESILEKLATM